MGNNILRRRECLPLVPDTEVRRVCSRRLLFGGGGGWNPIPEICFDVPYPVMRDVCFSAMDVLTGIDSAFSAAFGPFLRMIEDLLDAAMAPLLDLLDPIINAVTPDINFGTIPNLPSFDFSLPSLPELSCPLLTSF